MYWPDWNANVRATFIIDTQGDACASSSATAAGELPDPDKILAERQRSRFG